MFTFRSTSVDHTLASEGPQVEQREPYQTKFDRARAPERQARTAENLEILAGRKGLPQGRPIGQAENSKVPGQAALRVLGRADQPLNYFSFHL